MSAALELAPQDAEAEDVCDLRELLTARRALVKDQVAAKTRLATAINPLIQRQLNRRIGDIIADIKALDDEVAQIAKTRGSLADRIARLTTILGIGRSGRMENPEMGRLV